MNNDTNTQTLEQQYELHDKLQREFDERYPDGFDRESDMLDAMKQMNLYCGTCGHGNGCEHGVPRSRY